MRSAKNKSLNSQKTDSQLPRRDLFRMVAGALAVSAARAGSALADSHAASALVNNDWVIEWNAHIFSPDTNRFPIHQQAVYKPDLSKHPADPLAAYLDRLREQRIDRAVIVQPEPYGDDHRLVLDCLRREPDRLRGTSLFYPRDARAPQKLAELVRQEPRIVSTRFHAHRGKENYLDSFADAGVRALWKQAVNLNLIVELHIGPNYAGQVGKLMRDFPASKVLIDHLAEPHLGSAVEFADVLDLATFTNVYMKLSGLGHFATDAPYYDSARSFTRRVVQAFGPNRMVWGSGPPDIVDRHLADYSDADRRKVKGTNLRNLLNWT
ncbi:amidohydrolase family protein [Spirosoma montaniterrae]|uniref:Amidohydrolase-related domain-containing protein n=1 Tax=Spirosoma montaniterrae TaxID=1178516 RepID=A0A1P9WXW8_9BACT|nr:amidohydrolase family protein [Spirosoma montaniterrae]AQG80203.1 hypothetical protein AWR27_13275 [Spirosoma montaniterrae]